MEADCQVTIKGLPEPVAQNVGKAVAVVVKMLGQAGHALDLRRMHRVVVTTDFAGELSELSGSTASGNPITYTQEEYGIAVGKVVALPRDDSDREIVLVIDARIAPWLAPREGDGGDPDDLQTSLHLLHHELCHVHDTNKMIDAFPNLVLRERYAGKDMLVRPLAELCWAEYIADVMSSSTASENWLATASGMFADAVVRTKPAVDSEILSYRYHRDVDRLLQVFSRHGHFLVKTAAYMLGYMDGLEISLSRLSPATAEKLSGSYFDTTWQALHEALEKMRRLYPDGWKDLSVYDDLAAVLEEYYAMMGLVLSTVANGQAYVHVPLRPGTIPNRREST